MSIPRATILVLSLLVSVWLQPAAAQDTVIPAEAHQLLLTLDEADTDIQMIWDPVTLDATGQMETVEFYNIYRGTGQQFPLGFKLIGTSTTPDFVDAGAGSGPDYFYLVTAVDDSGNEGAARSSPFTTVPVLSGGWTASTIDLTWTDAEPAGSVTSYRVYYGPARRTYTYFEDVDLTNSHSLIGLQPNMNWYASVVAVDAEGNESALSNEHFDALGGTIDLVVHDESRLCFGGCPPQANEIQRNSGREIMIPVEFPEGDWTKIELTFIADSRLCIREDPHYCAGPPWNPCGDPWDRTASVYLVLDDCISTGGNCYGQQGNLELIRTVTPFGTDADPPDGTGRVQEAVWTFDVTPYAPVLTGTKYVGAFIGVWVSPGWYVTTSFHFSEAEVSPKPPADGVAPVWFRDGGNSSDPTYVTIPSEAVEIKARLFSTGHGGVTGAECACGAAAPCDEFCPKWVWIFVDDALKERVRPWRDDCSPVPLEDCVLPEPPGSCSDWNSCGCPSCSYSRSGWCPGYIACHNSDPGCDQDFDATGWFDKGVPEAVRLNVQQMTSGASWANSMAIFWYLPPAP